MLSLIEFDNTMGKISIQPNCGNSPRKQFLRDLNVAFVNGDEEYLLSNISENINWEILGKIKVAGQEDYLNAIMNHKLWKAKELVVDTIITHGPDASVSGTFISSDNSKYAFCDIYRFKGAGGFVINSIATFLIKQ